MTRCLPHILHTPTAPPMSSRPMERSCIPTRISTRLTTSPTRWRSCGTGTRSTRGPENRRVAVQDEPDVLPVLGARDAAEKPPSPRGAGDRRPAHGGRLSRPSRLAAGDGRLRFSWHTRKALGLAAVLVLFGWAGSAHAAPDDGAAVAALANQPKFLPVDQVFHLSATAAGPDAVRLDWSILKGYYLYRSRLRVSPVNGLRVGTLRLPRGEIKMDPYFGREEIYRLGLTGLLPLERSSSARPGDASLRVIYQGCADAGLCYPPVTKTLTVSLPLAGA